MSQFEHVLKYSSTEDLITQIDQLLTKLLGGASAMEDYDVVRARYPHLSGPAFTMRLKRFTKEYPREMSPTGKRTVKLFVTRELHEHLRKGAK